VTPGDRSVIDDEIRVRRSTDHERSRADDVKFPRVLDGNAIPAARESDVDAGDPALTHLLFVVHDPRLTDSIAGFG
jgi:hypothetical protein